MANTYLKVSTSSSGTRTKWTASFWVKRCNLSNKNIIFGSYLDSSNNDVIRFNNVTGELQFWSYQAGSYSNGGYLKTNRVFRDTNAWYHIVCRWDSNNSTANDRMKIWVNGVEETSFSSRTNPTSGRESLINYQDYTTIGKLSSDYFDGVLSHVHFCDNQLYQASDFGETDSTTGEWKIKTEPNVNYGTTGYFILKDGNSLVDQSSNSNNLTLEGGTLTKTEDNPSNVFATLNPLYTFDSALSYTKGNTVVAYSGSGADSWTTRYAFSTLGMTSGKYYAETKIAAIGTNQMYVMGIISDPSANAVNSSFGYLSNAYAYYCADGRIISGASDLQTGIGSATTNDVVGLAFDADNGTMQLYKNGSAIGSQVTGIPVGDRTWHFGSDFYSTGKIAWNFGNGYFEETAVSSAGTNASGNGIFEYDVPAGYTALSTKGLNL